MTDIPTYIRTEIEELLQIIHDLEAEVARLKAENEMLNRRRLARERRALMRPEVR